MIRDIVQRCITQANFQDLIRRATEDAVGSGISDKALKEAARTFWKALAMG